VEGEYGLENVVLGLPSMINDEGVKILAGYPLTDRERDALHASSRVVQQAISDIA
jgi:malate/lactate dehydrogenase